MIKIHRSRLEAFIMIIVALSFFEPRSGDFVSFPPPTGGRTVEQVHVLLQVVTDLFWREGREEAVSPV